MSAALRRAVFLAAVFALVFAPGALARSGPAAPQGEHDAVVAVLAPTFDQGDLLGRRHTDRHEHEVRSLILFATALALSGLTSVAECRSLLRSVTREPVHRIRSASLRPLRAPPLLST